MIALFDAGFLQILFDEKARVPHDSKGEAIVGRAKERISFLVQTMSQRRDKIILPTPALAEFMLLASDRWNDYLAIIRRKAVFEIAGFDDPEAVELVEHWLRDGNGRKLKARRSETWAKLKYDRQIAAIAVTHRVECIYSTDEDLRKYAERLGKDYYGLTDLPLPPPEQVSLPLEDPPDTEEPTAVATLPLDRHPEGQAGSKVAHPAGHAQECDGSTKEQGMAAEARADT